MLLAMSEEELLEQAKQRVAAKQGFYTFINFAGAFLSGRQSNGAAIDREAEQMRHDQL